MDSVCAITPLLTMMRGVIIADPQLSAIVGSRVYDIPPESAVGEWIALYTIISSDWGTATEKGQKITAQINCHSQPASGTADTQKLRLMMSHIRRLFDRPNVELTLPHPHQLVLCMQQSSTGILQDTDSAGLFGAVTLEILTRNRGV